jgi:hypothetical protein
MANGLVKITGPQRAVPPARLTAQPARADTFDRACARDRRQVRRSTDEARIEANASALRVPKADTEDSVQHHAAPAVSPDAGVPGRYPATLISAVLGPFRAELRRLAEQRALSQATRLLGCAPDTMLKDIGVTRCEIIYNVRHGRDCKEDWKAGPWF